MSYCMKEDRRRPNRALRQVIQFGLAAQTRARSRRGEVAAVVLKPVELQGGEQAVGACADPHPALGEGAEGLKINCKIGVLLRHRT